MDGVTIINTIEYVKNPLWEWIIISIIGAIIISYFIVEWLESCEAFSINHPCLIFLLNIIIINAIIIGIGAKQGFNIQCNEYYAIIDNDVSLADVVENYDIVHMSGGDRYYYVLKDKEQSE